MMLIYLFYQTLLESIAVGTIITSYDQAVVIKAFVITTVVFTSLTLYTMQSKYDYSTWGARYLVIAIGHVVSIFSLFLSL